MMSRDGCEPGLHSLAVCLTARLVLREVWTQQGFGGFQVKTRSQMRGVEPWGEKSDHYRRLLSRSRNHNIPKKNTTMEHSARENLTKHFVRALLFVRAQTYSESLSPM